MIAADSGSSHPQGSAERGKQVAHNVGEIARLDVEVSVESCALWVFRGAAQVGPLIFHNPKIRDRFSTCFCGSF
jgi:hypothetical protein